MFFLEQLEEKNHYIDNSCLIISHTYIGRDIRLCGCSGRRWCDLQFILTLWSKYIIVSFWKNCRTKSLYWSFLLDFKSHTHIGRDIRICGCLGRCWCDKFFIILIVLSKVEHVRGFSSRSWCFLLKFRTLHTSLCLYWPRTDRILCTYFAAQRLLRFRCFFTNYVET